MATRQQSTLLSLRYLSGKLLTAPDTAFLLHNVYEDSEDGTLTSVPDVQSYTNENDFWGNDLPTPWVTQSVLKAQTYWSIFHALLPNGYDCVLIHAGAYIYKYEGARNAWYKIFDNPIISDDSGRYNTQWIATPTGVIIIPPRGQALFYDGEKCGYLGYNIKPKPPEGMGPRSTNAVDKLYEDSQYPHPGAGPTEQIYGKPLLSPENKPSMNSDGYAHDGLYNFSTGMMPDFGVGRVGTAVTPPGIWSAQGKLLKGSYQVCVQYVDVWGNLSPVSFRSSPVTFDEQFSWYGTLKKDGDDFVPDVGVPATADRVKKQIIWTNVPTGPENTIGRILYRTKDTYNSGDLNIYELVGNAAGGSDSFATMPDNASVMFPDNIPDAWLINPAMDIVPVPEFRFGVVAFGRFWIGNTIENKGLIRPSIEGLWGTFRANEEIVPDPRGYEITGMKSISGQLLVFTAKSIFLLKFNEQGNDFITITLSNNIGCVAPDSLVILPDNQLIWLSDNGFYSWDSNKITKISGDIDYFTRRINTGRIAKAVATFSNDYSAYVCYVPYEGSTHNNMAFVYNGKNWSSQSQLDIVTGICETQDNRKYLLACGYNNKSLADGSNVYVLNTAKGTSKTTIIETGWINLINPTTNSIQTIYVLVRDTLYQEDAIPFIADVTISDYMVSMEYYVNMDMDKKGTARFRVSSPSENQQYFNKRIQSYFALSEMYPKEIIYKRSRLFWLKVDILAPQANSFKLKFSTTKYLKFMGISFNAIPTGDGLTDLPVVSAFGGTE